MYTPVNLSFTTQKWGVGGVNIIEACFPDENIFK